VSGSGRCLKRRLGLRRIVQIHACIRFRYFRHISAGFETLLYL